MAKKYLHQDKEFNKLIELVASDLAINPYLVEKDYWIMHCLYGLKLQGFEFELKGGTSLSKGYKIIHRFSEDIDLKIIPSEDMKVKSGRNHIRKIHLDSRKYFFNWLIRKIKIDGVEVSGDTDFYNDKFMSAGISLSYKAHFDEIRGVKPIVLLETGFDDTTPNKPLTISSWVFDKAFNNQAFNYIDNRAKEVKCYIPEYTFVEKLQAIATKYRKFQESGRIEKNFMRHYYDVFCLLDLPEIQKFLGSEVYEKRKLERFPVKDNSAKLYQNPAFINQKKEVFEILNKNYLLTENLYYNGQPNFKDILNRINKFRDKF